MRLLVTGGAGLRITRGTNTYGPFQHPEKIVPLFIANLLDGASVPLYGDGGNIREWLHVADHCRGIQLVPEKGQPGEGYNIGGGTALANRELAAKLVKLCGASSRQVTHVADRKGHDWRYAVDWSKIRARLGYRPLVGLEHGLRCTVRWYLENRWWWNTADRPVVAASGGSSR
jgi:dTDP-glucose 4,6-dehydratase